MTSFASKAQVIDALIGIHERVLDDLLTVQYFGGALLIREPTARVRDAANSAALADNPDEPDNTLYRAMLIHYAVVDPESGKPYADGRLGTDGQPLIDPRTRVPLLSIEQVNDVVNGRPDPMLHLIQHIMELAGMTQSAMFSRHSAPDGAERDARASDADSSDAAPPDRDP